MKRVLIIEEDQAIACIEQDYLEISGFHVELAKGGDLGLEKAYKGSYDIIVLDLALSGVDGFALCNKLKQTIDIPILLITAAKRDIEKLKELGLSEDDYIIKPFLLSELSAKIRGHIARYERVLRIERKIRSGQDILAGDLRIKTRYRKAFCRGKEIPLKSEEYDLLLFLVKNAGIVFSQERLFAHIRGTDYFDESTGDGSSIAVYIDRLREKIEKEPKKPVHIETVWGSGYRYQLNV